MEQLTVTTLAELVRGDDIGSMVIGATVLVAGLVLINLGRLLPGLLSTLDGRSANPRGG